MPKSEEKTEFTEPNPKIIIVRSFKVDLSGAKEKLEAIKRSRSGMSSAEQNPIQDGRAEEAPEDGTSSDR